MAGSTPADVAAALAPGDLVAVADGVGTPLSLSHALAEVSPSIRGLRVLLGWCLAPPFPSDAGQFADIRTIMSGYQIRPLVKLGRAHYVPVRLGSVPALLAGPLKPQVVLLGVRPSGTGFAFGSEVAWMRAALDAGARALVEVNHGLPRAADDEVIPRDRVQVVAEIDRPPVSVGDDEPDPVTLQLAGRVTELVREGAAIQVGPGKLGRAVLDSLRVPVRVVSGVVTDGVVDLDNRGLLLRAPTGAYLAGSERLYAWADGQPIARRLERSHDLGWLSSLPLVAVNTALEIDTTGQVNVETIGDNPISGIGGHSDFALAAARSAQGVSIIAMPSEVRGRPTLVERLSAPVSTARTEVDVVVTERGSCDLRGKSDGERGDALRDLWRA